MKHELTDLSLDELHILILALDFYLCNDKHGKAVSEIAESLLLHIDFTAEAAEAQHESNRIVESDDNLIVVDFRPKNG